MYKIHNMQLNIDLDNRFTNVVTQSIYFSIRIIFNEI